MLRYMRELTDEFVRRLKDRGLLSKRRRKDDEGDDENTDWSDELDLEMEILIAWWLQRINEFQDKLALTFGALSLFNDRQFRASIRSVVGIHLPQSQTLGYAPGELVTATGIAQSTLGTGADVDRVEKYIEAMRKNFVSSGSTALDRMGENFIATSERELRRAVLQGDAINDIVAAIRNRAATLENQALLTGRDEVARLDGELTMRRQMSVNIFDYVWRTRRDERVRPTHQALEGSRQRWDSPPATGHPGQAHLCRCRAIPIK